MNKTESLPIALREKEIASFCRHHAIRKLSLFGSVLRDDFSPESDIDFLVEFEANQRVTFFDLAEMETELSGLCEGRKVDLRTPQELSIYFRERVIGEALPIYDGY